jgi:methionyl aminopeptidase
MRASFAARVAALAAARFIAQTAGQLQKNIPGSSARRELRYNSDLFGWPHGLDPGCRTVKELFMSVSIKSEDEFARMRVAGAMAAEVLEMIEPLVVPGISTGELDRICHEYITKTLDAIPAPLNYNGFPRSICTSVNDVVCHGIPSEAKKLKAGDIVNIDVTVIKDGYHGDTSIMVGVGEIPSHAERLVRITQECLYQAIALVRPGARLGDIGHVIQQHAEANYYSVVREYCGHGIGKIFHEDPQVLHYGRPNTGLVLKPGMTFTIEPMINAGKRHTRLNTRDGWTVTTRDGRLSAQWEHTLGVTEDGCEIFTRRSNESI